MILEKIDESISLGEMYINSKSSKKYLETLQHYEPEFISQMQLLRRVLLSREALKNVVMLENDESARIERIVENIKSDLSKMDSDVLERDYNAFSGEITRKYNDTKSVWTSYRAEHMKAQENLIISLQNIIDNDGGMAELGELKQNIYSKELADSDTIDRIQQFVQKCNDIIKEMNIDENIETFLIKVSSENEVTLADIDEEIFEWLKNNDLLKKLKLVM